MKGGILLNSNLTSNHRLDMNKLVNEYGNQLLRMCFLYLKDIHLAEDAVQDTFIKAYKNYSQFKGIAQEKTWIMRIAINVCKNYLRKSWWKQTSYSKLLKQIPYNDPENIGDDTLLLEIMKLSSKYKEVILLFYYQEMKIREISEALQISESTVSVRLARARKILKRNLKGWYYEE
jgi:RNA polymerase sigma factor (sigma-70 family)